MQVGDALAVGVVITAIALGGLLYGSQTFTITALPRNSVAESIRSVGNASSMKNSVGSTSGSSASSTTSSFIFSDGTASTSTTATSTTTTATSTTTTATSTTTTATSTTTTATSTTTTATSTTTTATSTTTTAPSTTTASQSTTVTVTTSISSSMTAYSSTVSTTAIHTTTTTTATQSLPPGVIWMGSGWAVNNYIGSTWNAPLVNDDAGIDLVVRCFGSGCSPGCYSCGTLGWEIYDASTGGSIYGNSIPANMSQVLRYGNGLRTGGSYYVEVTASVQWQILVEKY